jgi:hypothetical protein
MHDGLQICARVRRLTVTYSVDSNMTSLSMPGSIPRRNRPTIFSSEQLGAQVFYS